MKILDETGHPMMSDEEMQIINTLIQENECQTCLEWGSGNSTVYFPQENPCIADWFAVEHNHVYLELLENKIDKVRTHLFVVANPDGYVIFPYTLERQFDFILIDGLEREKCIKVALDLVTPKGIILLHDACRRESAEIMKKYRKRIELLIEGEQMLANGFYAHRGLALIKHD